MRNQVDCVVFDFDGTLADTLPGIEEAVLQATSTLGLSGVAREYVAPNIGMGMNDLCRGILEMSGQSTDPDRVEELAAMVKSRYHHTWRDHTRVFPGVGELIADLVRRGVRLSVLSNKAHEFTVEMARTLFPGEIFHRIYGISDSIPAKPNPRGLLGIIEESSSRPENALMVGDMAIDVRTGDAAGVRTVGVAWGYQGTEAFKVNVPWKIIARPADLSGLLS